MFKFIKEHLNAFWPGSLAGGSATFLYLLHLPPLPHAELIGIIVKIGSIAGGSFVGGMATLLGNDVYKHYKEKIKNRKHHEGRKINGKKRA